MAPTDTPKATQKVKTVVGKTNPTKQKSSPVTIKKKKASDVEANNSVPNSKTKSWKRRPKPAHSGVPVPEKMKKLILKKKIDTEQLMQQ